MSEPETPLPDDDPAAELPAEPSAEPEVRRVDESSNAFALPALPDITDDCEPDAPVPPSPTPPTRHVARLPGERSLWTRLLMAIPVIAAFTLLGGYLAGAPFDIAGQQASPTLWLTWGGGAVAILLLYTVFAPSIGRRILAELLAAFSITFLTITALVVLQGIGRVADRDLGTEFLIPLIPQVLTASMGHVLPVSVLIACVLVYGRLSADGEVVVLQASGVSPLKLISPAIALGVALSVFLWMFINSVQPHAYFTQRALLYQAVEARITNPHPGYTRIQQPKFILSYANTQDGSPVGVIISLFDQRPGTGERPEEVLETTRIMSPSAFFWINKPTTFQNTGRYVAQPCIMTISLFSTRLRESKC
jgi:hypothetical protein